jgi:multiple sugar transport system permease protein
MQKRLLTKTISVIIFAAFWRLWSFRFWILVTSFMPSSEIFGKATAFQVIATIDVENFAPSSTKDFNSIKNSFIVATLTTLYVVSVAS